MLAQRAGRRRERVQAHAVVVERGRDQLRQAGRVEQARTDAARERLARAGQQRNARPERVASGRVRSVRKRVERKIGAAQPRDVRFLRRVRGEEKSRRIDACLRGERAADSPARAPPGASSHSTAFGTRAITSIQIANTGNDSL